jgi:hypothetical protein
MRDRDYDEPDDMFAWEACCGVCGNWFDNTHLSKDNPYPHGAFCPVCRKNGLMAPGVLNFKPVIPKQL